MLMSICTLFTSVAQIIYKFGLNQDSITTKLIFIAIGLSLYGVGAVLLTLALKGGELSILYPIIATSYIWVNLGANYFFNEPLTILKWIGIILIIMGVYYISKGVKK